MKYIVKQNTPAYRNPRTGIPLARIVRGFEFTSVDSFPGWVQFNLRTGKKERPVWIQSRMTRVVNETPSPLPPPHPMPPPSTQMVRLKFHDQMPAAMQNRGSFGIVPFSATARWNKAHSVVLDSAWVNFIRQLQTQDFYDENILNYACNNPAIQNRPGQPVDPDAAFRWLFEHENTKFFGAHFGKDYSIPAQGCFGGNLISTIDQTSGVVQALGLSGNPPKIEDVYNRPDLIHFCWCVGPNGNTINPPCKSAFFPVINPVGMRGVTNAINQQTQIWVRNIWLG